MRSDGRVTKRVIATCCSLVLFAGLAVIAPAAVGAAEPAIAFLNPSSFSAAGERGIIISDQEPSAGPGCCDLADGTYRLSAWVAAQPEGSFVFFTVRQSALEFEIASTQETPRTWVAEWEIPSDVLDGPATVNAYLIQNEEVLASATQAVTIMRSQDNVDITWPRPGERFGTYSALATSKPAEGVADPKAPAGVMDVLYTDSAQISYVRSFYTTSAPGEVPVWKVCATETVGSSSAGNGMRCSVDAADRGAITAMAAVPNSSPDTFEARFNGSGDAIPISESYAQEATVLELGGAHGQNVGKESGSGRFFCSDNQEVRLLDQIGRAIPGANIDVHAVGPSDRLAFHTFSVLTVNQPPDRGGHRTETAFDCTGQSATVPPSNANPGQQGEHQRFGAPDRKHIESRPAGTSDLGTFTFRLHSDSVGTTSYTVWVDEFDDGCHANDDAFSPGELAVSGAVGWQTQPGIPEVQPFETPIPCGPGEEPPPEPEPEPSPPGPSGSRRIALSAFEGKAAHSVIFKGRIQSESPECRSYQHVALQVRRQRGFTEVDETTTDGAGRYSFRTKVRKSKAFRTVAVERGFCERARSVVVRVRPRE